MRIRRRIHTPTILQMEVAECGAAALGIILGYHGRFEPLTRLRTLCGVSRDGSRASKLLAAARQIGLTAQAYRVDPEELRKLPLPLIVYWNFNHFLVVEGFGGNRVYLNDPGHGRRTVSMREFDEAFTGIALVFQKGPHFQPAGTPRSSWRTLRNQLRGRYSAVLYIMLASLALTAPSVLAAALPTVFLDHILIGGMTLWLRPVTAILLLTTVAMIALTLVQQRALLRLETDFALGNSSSFLWRLLRLPLDFFAHRQPGDLAFRAESNESIARLLFGDFAVSLAGVALAGIYLTLLFRLDQTLTIIGLGIALLNLLVLKLVSRRHQDESRRLTQERGKLMGISVDGLLSIETLKATGAESGFFTRWCGQHAKVTHSELQFFASSQIIAILPSLLLSLNTAALLTLGAARVMDGVLTIGLLIAFQFLMRSFLEPVQRLTALAGHIQQLQGDQARLEDVLENPVETWREPEGENRACRLAGAVEIRQLSFGYSRLEAPLIHNFNLKIAPGCRVALVGKSGSGKSTLAHLIAGIHAPWAGEVCFDGINRQELTRDVITSSVAMVDQTITLFEGTISENIALWDESLETSCIRQAAQDAVIHEEILRMPGGYAAMLEESGRNLSGGQRQRLEIARALALEPRILILDEATSALDPLTEARLMDNLRRRGCSCIIVAHRLSTIRDCDEIIFLDGGTVVERGTHQELMARRGSYYNLVREEK